MSLTLTDEIRGRLGGQGPHGEGDVPVPGGPVVNLVVVEAVEGELAVVEVPAEEEVPITTGAGIDPGPVVVAGPFAQSPAL
ncbi:hypothetical protein AB0M64_23675 [Streptomyces sp. NPDC051771]|uniref:hypothetical protein n=1 Tax=Streptomyces sp. NPDC051771 TaxID=3154847 RepID=UPI0034174528